jgi:hypothetical protein
MERVLDFKHMDANEFQKQMELVAAEFDTPEKREMLSPGRALSPKKKTTKSKEKQEMDEEDVKMIFYSSDVEKHLKKKNCKFFKM